MLFSIIMLFFVVNNKGLQGRPLTKVLCYNQDNYTIRYWWLYYRLLDSCISTSPDFIGVFWCCCKHEKISKKVLLIGTYLFIIIELFIKWHQGFPSSLLVIIAMFGKIAKLYPCFCYYLVIFSRLDL